MGGVGTGAKACYASSKTSISSPERFCFQMKEAGRVPRVPVSKDVCLPKMTIVLKAKTTTTITTTTTTKDSNRTQTENFYSTFIPFKTGG